MKNAILFLVFIATIFGSCQNRKEKSPDVIMIAVDDLNDWVGFLGGHPHARTPNLDRLASTGMVFTRAYCAAPVCNPSRSALLSGVSPHKSGVYGNSDTLSRSPIFKDIQTLPKYLSANRYFTTGQGKLFHQMTGPLAFEEQWDHWVHPTGEDMHEHEDRKNGVLANGMWYTTRFQYGLDWSPNAYPLSETRDYQTAQWAANELLKAHEKPVFIAAGLFRPHLPWYVPQEYYDRFPLEEVIVPDINESDLDDLGQLAKVNSGGLDSTKDYLRIKKHDLQKEAVQAYLAAISYADDCLGVILDAIEKNPEKENTIVVLWGDHGWHLGEKLHYRKFSMWEEACRVPLMISAPGLTKPGSISDRVVNLLDIYPTLVELTGLPENPENDGRSIVSLLNDPEQEWPYASVSFDRPHRSTARTERWRYIQYEDGSTELYDHKVDSLEWNNLSENPQYAAVMDEMKK